MSGWRSDSSASPLRAVGVRTAYLDIPAAVRDWVEQELGSTVVEAVTQPGGMSPGCAARLRLADGARVFVKAVGSNLNPRTPGLHRSEVRVLRSLPPVGYRAPLRAAYDDDDWVAMILDDVQGRHPNWSDASDIARVASAVERQTEELTPAPPGLDLTPAADMALRWRNTLRAATPDELAVLPPWLTRDLARAEELLDLLPQWLAGDTMCHWDIRNDNLLIRPDGSVVIVDWGQARRGPAWADIAIFALEWAETTRFDEILATSRFAASVDGDALTALLLGVGVHSALMAASPAPPGLPTMPAFQRREGARFLAGARRRLSLAP